MKERDLIREAKKYVNNHGGTAYKMHGSPFMETGIPDLLICYRGRFIGAEAKKPEGTVSAVQQMQLDRIRIAHGASFVFRSLAEFVKELEKTLVDKSNQKECYTISAFETSSSDEGSTKRLALKGRRQGNLHQGSDVFFPLKGRYTAGDRK